MGTNIITKVNELLVKEDAINKATARNLNIYKILGIESKETYICRAMAALLDDNYHNQGNCFLELFFKYVLGREYKDNNYKIITEETIDNYRRIDIVIKSNNEYIPIEAKIYAGDQQNQCYDYFKWASDKEGDKAKVYYLTLDGHLPSKESVKDLEAINGKEDENNKNDNIVIGYKGIECISFRKHILDWLSECLKCDCAIRIDNIRNMILQLQENIRELTFSGDNINSKIQSYFNSENIKNVVNYIYNKNNKIKIDIRKKIFDIIKIYYKENVLFEEKLNETWPYVRFKIGQDKVDTNTIIDICFSIELNESNGKLWAGINCSKDGKWFDAVKEGCYKKYINSEDESEEWFTKGWWLVNKTIENTSEVLDYPEFPDFRNLIEVSNWWNEKNIRKLLKEIDVMKEKIMNLFKRVDFEGIKENLSNYGRFENINNSLFSFEQTFEQVLNEVKPCVKISEAFEEYKIIFQKEWINFLANKIEDETNSKRINVKNNKGLLLSEYLYFNLYNGKYDGKDYHILYAIENIYCGLVVTDENYNQMIDSSKIKQEKAFPLLKNIEEELFDKKNKYKKEFDKYLDDWWLYWQNNKILDSNTDFEIKYLYKNSNNNGNIKDKIEIIINDIKTFRDKLNNKV